MNNFPKFPTKKSLRSIGLLLFSMFVITAFTSCDPEDDGFSYYDIVGSWIQVAPDYGTVYDFNGDGTGDCYDNYNGYSYFEWEAYDDGTLNLYFTDGYYETSESYTWSFQGNSLYLYPSYDYSNPLVLQPY